MAKSGLSNLSIEKLEKAHFGDPDATRDVLIRERLCICKNRAISDFLQDRFTILVGDRGSGKTALFELLRTGKLEFASRKNQKNVIVAIAESLDYKALEQIVVTKIQSKSGALELHHRAIWEFLVLYKIIQQIREFDQLPGEIQEIIAKIDERFEETNKGQSFFATFEKGKKRIAVKLDASAIAPNAPDFYATVGSREGNAEGAIDTTEANPGSILQIGKIKEKLNEFLTSRGVRLHILVDKIDEFVIRDEYKTQKHALNALVTVEQDYLRYDSMSLKLFLRSDLFGKINLKNYGADKVVARKIELKWSEEEIRDFLAKRILYNLLTIHETESLRLEVNAEKIYLNSKSNFDAIRDRGVARIKSWILVKKNYFLARTLGRVFPRFGKDHFHRHSNFNDKINRVLIQIFFGEHQSHLTEDGQQTIINTCDYLSTHFRTGNGTSTPRLMLMFMDEALRSSADYYRKNSCIMVDEPIAPFSICTEIYESFRRKLWESINHECGGAFERFLAGQRCFLAWSFSGEEFAKCTSLPWDQLGEKLAILSNLGVLAPLSRELDPRKRSYNIPVLFRLVGEK